MSLCGSLEKYVTRPSTGGNGIYFFTSVCGNIMYYCNYNPMKYNNCICPKCGRTLVFDKEDIKRDE